MVLKCAQRDRLNAAMSLFHYFHCFIICLFHFQFLGHFCLFLYLSFHSFFFQSFSLLFLSFIFAFHHSISMFMISFLALVYFCRDFVLGHFFLISAILAHFVANLFLWHLVSTHFPLFGSFHSCSSLGLFHCVFQY